MAAQEKEKGLWSWVKERWYDYKEKKENLDKYFKDCNEAADLRKTIEEIYELITSWNEIKSLYEQISYRLNEYLKTLDKADNFGRYQAGRLIIPASTLIIPLGVGVVSKAAKLKNTLKQLKGTSAEKWKEFTDEIKKLSTKSLGKVFKEITTDVRAALNNRIDHITKIIFEKKGNGYKFAGCHSKSAIDELGANARIEITVPANAEGVYEAKVFAKDPSGIERMKSGNEGKSTFFPDNWDEARILDEVEYVVKNNKGLINPTDITKGYYGFSKNGNIKIGFYYRDVDGYIGSFFPILP